MTEVNLEKVSKSYQQKPSTLAVKEVDLTVVGEEFLCIVGPSGCGKSTLLKLIAGLEEPSSGIIQKPEKVAMVFQSGALFPWMNVEENVAFGLVCQGRSSNQAKQEAGKYLAMVRLTDFAKKYPRELSGGQRQRVGIARALAVEPEVLLLDEPFSALDTITTNRLHEDLLQIWQELGMTIIMVSHSLEEAVLLADRLVIMDQGQIKQQLEINLPRPRREHKLAFINKLEAVEKVFLTLTTS